MAEPVWASLAACLPACQTITVRTKLPITLPDQLPAAPGAAPVPAPADTAPAAAAAPVVDYDQVLPSYEAGSSITAKKITRLLAEQQANERVFQALAGVAGRAAAPLLPLLSQPYTTCRCIWLPCLRLPTNKPICCYSNSLSCPPTHPMVLVIHHNNNNLANTRLCPPPSLCPSLPCLWGTAALEPVLASLPGGAAAQQTPQLPALVNEVWPLLEHSMSAEPGSMRQQEMSATVDAALKRISETVAESIGFMQLPDAVSGPSTLASTGPNSSSSGGGVGGSSSGDLAPSEHDTGSSDDDGIALASVLETLARQQETFRVKVKPAAIAVEVEKVPSVSMMMQLMCCCHCCCCHYCCCHHYCCHYCCHHYC